MRLSLIATAVIATLGVATAQPDASIAELHVAVYNDVGAGRSRSDLTRSLRQMDGVYYREVTAREIRAGALKDFDLLIHPGGSGGKQARQLAEEGRETVRGFVRDGGGFIGICAGAYLASADYDWSLNILDARVLDRKHWARGTGTVDVGLSAAGKSFFGGDDDRLKIFYGQGPLLAPADNPDIPDYEVLASYESEIARNGAPKGVMIGTTAIARGRFGKGEVFCFSPHPEKTKALDSLLHQAIAAARAKRPPSTAEPLPAWSVEQIYLTPDISQKGMPNGDYCAPCAAANLLNQFHARKLIELPAEFTGATDESRTRVQRALAELLGDEAHMNTLRKKGTDRFRIANGLDRFLRAQDIHSLAVNYLGVRNYDRELLDDPLRPRTKATVGVPQLRHLQRELAANKGVAILFGSYKPNPDKGGRLERVGGHYVAAVGYGANIAGEHDPSGVILHDSNDNHQGVKFVYGKTIKERTELWERGKLLKAGRDLLQLINAPIIQDGRIAFLETVFSFEIKTQSAEKKSP